MSNDIVHLEETSSLDGSSDAWCDVGTTSDITNEVRLATCKDCLTAAINYGIDCAIRRAQIRDGLEPRNLSRADIEAFLDGKMKP